MARRCDFPTFDADNHLYETKDAFLRHLPKQYKGAIDYVDVHGRTKIVVKGLISEYIPNPTFDKVAAPGAQEEYFRNGNPDGKSYRELVGDPIDCLPGFRSPGPRIELMDELGVDQTLMFPTLASLLEERLRNDPELTHEVVHALNRWLLDEWTFDFDNRIFTTPVITLPIVEKAIEELRWCVENGAKVVLIRPAPVPTFGGSRSFALPYFDAFWNEVVDSGILVAMHASDSGYSRYQSDWTGPSEMLPFRLDAFKQLTGKGRPIQDACAALTCHGLLTRFPDLRIALVENGADWVPTFLDKLDHTYKLMPQMFEEHPVDAFRRCVYVNPFHEDDFEELAELVGVDHVLFGSDYPHPEGLAEPCSYVEHLPKSFSDEDVAKIMGGNLGRIMRVPVAA